MVLPSDDGPTYARNL